VTDYFSTYSLGLCWFKAERSFSAEAGAATALSSTMSLANPGQISALYPHLRQAVEQSGGKFDKAIEANAKVQADLLRTSSTVIRDAVRDGKLRVEAGVYDLATGKVTLS
jgi:carbonic anhydrase